jgi:hypothetical protein
VAIQAEDGVVGAVALTAGMAVVVSAAMLQGAVEAEDLVGPLADEVGVPSAVRADGAGP